MSEEGKQKTYVQCMHGTVPGLSVLRNIKLINYNLTRALALYLLPKLNIEALPENPTSPADLAGQPGATSASAAPLSVNKVSIGSIKPIIGHWQSRSASLRLGRGPLPPLLQPARAHRAGKDLSRTLW